MEETVEHVSKAFLGLTMNCAKCHDHKYDPIEQVDFYRMRAFFEPYHVRQDLVPGEANLTRDGIPRAFDRVLDAPTYRFERGQEADPDRSTAISPGVPAILAFADLKIEPIPLPVEAWQPARRPWVLETYLAASQQQMDAAESTLQKARDTFQAAQQTLAATEPTDETTGITEGANECRLAELAAELARAEHRSVVCRANAMRASWAKADALVNDPALAAAERAATVEAVVAERREAVSQKELELAKAEIRLAKAADDKKAAIEKEVAAARDALALATKAATTTVDATATYAPHMGAQWTPTRFLSSLADDPCRSSVSSAEQWAPDCARPLDYRSAQSTDRTCGRESSLEQAFRHTFGGHCVRLRSQGRNARRAANCSIGWPPSFCGAAGV